MQPARPIASPTPESDQLAGKPCGLIRQLLVMLYDAVIVVAILMIVGAIALLTPFKHQSAGQDPGYTLYLLLAWFLYLAWCWRHGGMTLGMRAWRVVLLSDHDGDQGGDQGAQPSWRQCGLRFAAAWLSAAAAGMGYWWKLFDRQHLSWHDRISHTRLVHFEKPVYTFDSSSTPQEIDRSKTQQ